MRLAAGWRTTANATIGTLTDRVFVIERPVFTWLLETHKGVTHTGVSLLLRNVINVASAVTGTDKRGTREEQKYTSIKHLVGVRR